MIATIKPSAIAGIVGAPTSKSSMQRACAAALISKGITTIRHPGHSNDDQAALQLIQDLGATVTMSKEKLIVTSSGIQPVKDEVDCGESGLGIRMFTPIIALADQEISINGTGSLRNRPMNFFDEILPKLGVSIRSNNGMLPLLVKGPLRPENILVDGSLSSQFLTGLLMAYSAADAKDVSIRVDNLASKPYVDLTLAVLEHFGLKLPQNRDYTEFYFSGEPHARPKGPFGYTVEGDWSGGAFLLVAGAIAGPVTIRGLDMGSKQADKVVMTALQRANASVAIEAKGIKVRPGDMKAFDFDATDCPDLFPPLVALAAYCKGSTTIRGVERLAYKESNRALSLQQEFARLGVKISVDNDTMVIEGNTPVGSKVHSHHDHRIAMACAVAALRANGQTEIEEAEAVKKSYPDFYGDLKSLGADVTLSSKIKFNE